MEVIFQFYEFISNLQSQFAVQYITKKLMQSIQNAQVLNLPWLYDIDKKERSIRKFQENSQL